MVKYGVNCIGFDNTFRVSWAAMCICGRTQGSKPLNMAVGHVQSFEINRCTVLPLAPNWQVCWANCTLKKLHLILPFKHVQPKNETTAFLIVKTKAAQ